VTVDFNQTIGVWTCNKILNENSSSARGCVTNVILQCLDKCLRFTHKRMKLQTDGEENKQKGRQVESQRSRQTERYTTKY
jgi:hypothetical protein